MAGPTEHSRGARKPIRVVTNPTVLWSPTRGMWSRLLVAGPLLVACSFEPRGGASSEPGSDGSSIASIDATGSGDDGGNAPFDAAPDDGPRPELPEILTIPGTGEVVTSQHVLATGVSYRLVASGTVSVADETWYGDAEYYWHEDSPGLLFGSAEGVEVGLAINDAEVNSDRSPNWGGFEGDHTYELVITGDGSAIIAQYHDPNYDNNSGSMTLEIHLQP
jgi:hypothetical protein